MPPLLFKGGKSFGEGRKKPAIILKKHNSQRVAQSIGGSESTKPQ